MRISPTSRTLFTLAALMLSVSGAMAQNTATIDALQGLAPVSALGGSTAGKAALTRNLVVTGDIQNGVAHLPELQSFADQQQQALRDGFVTFGNANGLADGLGSKLGGAYQGLTDYKSPDGGKTFSFSSLSPAVARLIAYAAAASGADSAAAKLFFANATDAKKKPVPAEELAILTQIGGTTDVFGKAYGLPAGSKGADPFGNSRPFQTEPHLVAFEGKDFFGKPSGNLVYLRGPAQDLTASPSYPSGHTTYGFTESLLLALLVPERYPQMVTRGAEYGHDRIVLGAHYAMDVLAGRTLAEYDLAQLLANKPGYVGVKRGDTEIDDFGAALTAARADTIKALETSCGSKLALCARQDSSRFAHPAKNRAFYEATQTYGLPVVFKQNAKGREDVGKLAPEAGYLLTAAFPYLTLSKADAILTATEGPGGGFLDNGSHFGIYSRLDLYEAAKKAIALAPKKAS